MSDDKQLTLEDAIKTALQFENKVRDTYLEAIEKAGGDTGKRVFGVLAREEQDHVDYLESRLNEWNKTGKINVVEISSEIPPSDVVTEQIDSLKIQLKPENLEIELRMLQRALEVEKETSAFYKKMVDTLPEGERELFETFLEIEEGHVAIVQAELDMLSGTGYFFDMGEFNLEAG